MRLAVPCTYLLPILSIGCGVPATPTAPTAPIAAAPARVEPIALEAEAGSGEGDLMHRSRASGALTIHLAPGQRRRWTFNVAQPSHYSVLVTYANDNPGATEVLRVEVDGEAIGAFSAQDTGDDGEGWNVFVADLAGARVLGTGIHTVTVESTGGDGCIEIDLITLRPDVAAGTPLRSPGGP
jgi:hypothetical protein